jgi:hypothetical protein
MWSSHCYLELQWSRSLQLKVAKKTQMAVERRAAPSPRSSENQEKRGVGAASQVARFAALRACQGTS